MIQLLVELDKTNNLVRLSTDTGTKGELYYGVYNHAVELFIEEYERAVNCEVVIDQTVNLK